MLPTFTKMTKLPIEDYLLASESKIVVVLLWLLANRDKNGMVYTTLEEAAKECAVTKITVNRTFKRLYAKGFLKRVRNGAYQLSL